MDDDFVDFLGLQAAELAGIPGWKAFRYETVEGGFLITGAVAKPYVRGSRKGQPNWKNLDPSTLKRIIITKTSSDYFIQSWESHTGKCSKCYGTGKESRGWTKAEGKLLRTCLKCLGTGKSVSSSINFLEKYNG